MSTTLRYFSAVPRFWATAALAGSIAVCGYAQTVSTGAVVGVTLDASGALLQGAVVTLTNEETGEKSSSASDYQGRFGFLLLTPGAYLLCAGKAEFAQVCSSVVHVNVTRDPPPRNSSPGRKSCQQCAGICRTADGANGQFRSLGRVVNEKAVSNLPLVTRNFAQIASLSPGVLAGVSMPESLALGVRLCLRRANRQMAFSCMGCAPTTITGN
jgi:Carboxypeptidase regulatory-like domain